MRLFQQRETARTAEHNRQVTRNEDEVIAGMAKLDPKDQSETANYIREVANDILARRAASN